MSDENRSRREVPVQHRLLAFPRFVQLHQRFYSLPRKGQSRLRIPSAIGGTLLNARGRRVCNRKEPHLARVPQRFLE